MTRMVKFLLAALGVLLVVEMIVSLQWRIELDAPIMFYVAFLRDRFGYVQYRDVFDVNMPGTSLAYLLMGKLSAYTDIGYRVCDLAILGLILLFTWLWMRRLGRSVACGAAFVFGLSYLSFGQTMSLQREYLALLPISAAMWLSSIDTDAKTWAKNLLVGFLFGVAAMIKPQTAIGLLPVLIFELWDVRPLARWDAVRWAFAQVLLPAAIGLAVPALAIVAYLWQIGALSSFLDVVRNYWPLYGSLNGFFEKMTGLSDQLQYIRLVLPLLGGFFVWLPFVAIALYVVLPKAALAPFQRRRVGLLGALAVCYALSPLAGAKLWTYHFLPFLYFVILLCSMCLVDQSSTATKVRQLLPPAVLTLLLLANTGYFLSQRLTGRGVGPPEYGRTDAMVAAIEANLHPGDTVQALDGAGGAIHAMLITRVRTATPFVAEFQFYHDVSTPYIQDLRRRFITDLQASRPGLIIEVTGQGNLFPSGVDTTRDFPELRSIIDTDYHPVAEGDGYTVYARR